MLQKSLFRKPKNTLEGYSHLEDARKSVSEDPRIACPDCKIMLFTEDLMKSQHVCTRCGYHFRIGPRKRIEMIADAESFEETNQGAQTLNLLGFPDYDNKLKSAREGSGEQEGVITGTARIDGMKCAMFIMDPYFMMGSMGTIVGEKITQLFELATQRALPVVGFTVSGGARIQEGILSLMQMAKTSGAVKYHSDCGNLYIAVLADPTTGGVTASFAMEADITLAEPRALIGFAGPRVIEQTIRQKLPEGFQKSEFLLKKGFVDKIVDRRELKSMLGKLLKFHEPEAAEDERI